MRALALLTAVTTLAIACASEEDEPTPTPPAVTTTTAGTGGATTSSTTSTTTTSAGGSGAGPADECFDYDAFSPMADVSFQQDVMPLFAASCNAVACHGSETSPDAGLYLGQQGANDAATASQVRAELVGVASTQAPAMPRVVAGDAENSFLMVKIDGDLTCPQVTCGSNGCGQRMPRGTNASPLSPAESDLIRSWIENGAPDN